GARQDLRMQQAEDEQRHGEEHRRPLEVVRRVIVLPRFGCEDGRGEDLDPGDAVVGVMDSRVGVCPTGRAAHRLAHGRKQQHTAGNLEERDQQGNALPIAAERLKSRSQQDHRRTQVLELLQELRALGALRPERYDHGANTSATARPPPDLNRISTASMLLQCYNQPSAEEVLMRVVSKMAIALLMMWPAVAAADPICPIGAPFMLRPSQSDVVGNSAGAPGGCFAKPGGPDDLVLALGTNLTPGTLTMDFSKTLTDIPQMDDFAIM